MILSALAVVFINNEYTLEEGAEQMAAAYQVFTIDMTSSAGKNIGTGLLNGLIMVSAIGLMTFVIVMLYRYNCMKCLIGYMMLCSTTLLGFLGGHLYYVAIMIYNLPVDKLSYVLILWNFAAVGVLAIFFGRGIQNSVKQGYLIATSVILAWHLNYFDAYTTWTLLFMLAMYDLCAVLTPCGPLKALVNLMSKDEAPEMPGLLYEADLPPEARRPGAPLKKSEKAGIVNSSTYDTVEETTTLPLAIARVYNLAVIGVPPESEAIFNSTTSTGGRASSPLLPENGNPDMPSNPSPSQLKAGVIVQLPKSGGRIAKSKRGGKAIYVETDRHGEPKRFLSVDALGRVFAESSDGSEEDDDSNTIRLGLGDFIFYSVLVSKAAQYSFTTFVSCVLVILFGLGGTLILLSVFKSALPALPISICLGIFFYFVTRFLTEPMIESVLVKPYYV